MKPQDSARPLGTLRALAPSVLGSMALSALGVMGARLFIPAEVLRADGAAVGNYLQTLGGIYAVLLAFIMVVVWGQFNEARNHVEREANELLDFCRTVRGFPAEVSANIHSFVRAYVERVTGPEWRAMGGADDPGFDAGWSLLDRVSDDFHTFEPKTEVQIALYGEMLSRLNGLCDARTSRLSSSRVRIPRALRVLLYTGALSVVLSMCLLAVESAAIHMIMTAAMAGAVSHVIFVIEDLDDCFKGHWRVSQKPFLRVGKYLDRVSGG